LRSASLGKTQTQKIEYFNLWRYKKRKKKKKIKENEINEKKRKNYNAVHSKIRIKERAVSAVKRKS